MGMTNRSTNIVLLPCDSPCRFSDVSFTSYFLLSLKSSNHKFPETVHAAELQLLRTSRNVTPSASAGAVNDTFSSVQPAVLEIGSLTARRFASAPETTSQLNCARVLTSLR